LEEIKISTIKMIKVIRAKILLLKYYLTIASSKILDKDLLLRLSSQ